MKVALCLSGQPRVVEVGFQKLNETEQLIIMAYEYSQTC